MIPELIPWQQLEPVAGAAPGTWRSCGVEPQFRQFCTLGPGWVRVHLQMASQTRARAEIRVDTGMGLDAAACIERVSFRGNVTRDFFVKLRQPVYGIRLDPLDMEGEFRLESFEIQPISRGSFVGHVLWATLKQVRLSRETLRSLGNGLGQLLRGRVGQLKRQLLQQVHGQSPLAPPPYDAKQVYDAWRQRRALTSAVRTRMRTEAASLAFPPLLSIVLPVTDKEEPTLRQTISWVRQQIYPHWELCLAADGPVASPIRRLLDECARQDARIQWSLASGDPAGALNAALARATGDYVMLLDAGDALAEEALFLMAQAVAAEPVPDMLYSDEDCIDAEGRHADPFFKPDWSPEYLLSCMYTGRLAAFRTNLVRELGGFRSPFAPAHDYDLALRVAAKAKCIKHIPHILYHARQRPGGAGTQDSNALSLAEAGRRALASHLEAADRAGAVSAGPVPLTYRVRFPILGRPKVSIIIPTAYRVLTAAGKTTTHVARCLASIRARSTYLEYEILLLDNDEVPPDFREDLLRHDVIRSPYSQPFNWAAAMNRGAALARGTHLLFLDDDTEILTGDWLECLLEYSQQSEIGAVGARLHFPDGRLQHTGVTVLNGTPGHPFYGHPENHPGYFYSNLVPRNYSAVTGACMMTRVEVFRELGGFDETFAVNFNDIDFCLRVRDSGRRVVCNPFAQLIHYETATKEAYFHTELNAFQERWRQQGATDPFYNPNLSIRFVDFRVDPDGQSL
jgi:O-antigen biosynthesis protein